VEEKYALNCSDCICTAIGTSCLLGPDTAGNFETIEANPEYANECDRSFCTCTTHSDFFVKANIRLDEALEKQSQLKGI
jgi:hypothetical protein